MTRLIAGALVLILCSAVTLVLAAPGGKAGGKPAGKPPGGNWSEHKPAGPGGLGGGFGNPNEHSGAAGAAAFGKKNQPQASGAEGAAAGAAASKRNQPQASGAEGAAAGAAAVNRNQPQASGAEGAVAGAAAVNRNQPQVSGAEGAAAGAAAANRNQPQYSGAAGAAAGYAAVRNSYDNPAIHGQQWYADNPTAWAPKAYAAGNAWTPATAVAAAAHIGNVNAAPVSFNYGTNVTCLNGNVVINGQNVATAEEFSQQASDLAQAGIAATPAADEKWLPLGVFALVLNEQQHPTLVLNFAVNEQGILRGNYTDEVTEHTQPIRGAVDKRTQRMAWTVGDNTDAVMEAGMVNLLQGEAPALLHKNGKTARWLLVRLNQPAAPK